MNETLPFALEIWDNAARLALPLWLKAWLGFLVLSFLASILFAGRYRPARWALGGFVASHLGLVVIALADLATLRRGLVSLVHVVAWAPAFLVIARGLPDAPPRSAYRLWCWTILFVIGAALVFDVRDAGSYLYHGLSSHPVFDGSAG